MRALTCYPHWAHAICWLGKPIENRGRPIPRALVGERIAIHAGATLDCVSGVREVRGLTRAAPRWALDLADHWPTEKIEPFRVLPHVWGEDGVMRPIATRSIVATAIVRPHEPDCGGWHLSFAPRLGQPNPTPPPWADPTAAFWWALSDVQRLVVPVPVRRGQLGLWRLPDDEAAAVDAAAKEAA